MIKLLSRILFILLMFIAQYNLAQQPSIVEESNGKEDKIKKIIAQLDTRTTFINTNSVHIWGGLIGVEIDKKHQYSFGLYSTINKPQEIYFTNSIGRRFREVGIFNIQYLSLGYQLTFFDKKNVLMSVPLEAGFGLGRATVQLTWLDNNVINKYEVTKYSKYIPIQAGYEVEWKFLKWLSLRAQTGYRQTVLTKTLNGKDSNINYSGFYYSYGLRIYFGKLYRAIQSKNIEKKSNEQ